MDIHAKRVKTLEKNLGVAQVISEMNCLSPIVLNDRPEFNRLCSESTSADYGNCWSYLVQSTFFGAWKYFDGENFVAVTTRYPGKPPFIIAKSLGPRGMEKAVQIALSLKKLSGEKVVFKNVGVNEEPFLRLHGFKDYAPGDYWDSCFKYDEDTFPESVVNLPLLALLKGRKFRSLRYHLNSLKKKHVIAIAEFRPRLLDDGLQVLDFWADSFKKRFKEDLLQNPLHGHSIDLHREYLTSLYASCNRQDVFSYLLYVDGAPKAFALAEKISPKSVGVYSNISTNEMQGLSEAVLYETLLRCKHAGFLEANLGGSEFETLHEYKQKFASSFIPKKHVVLY